MTEFELHKDVAKWLNSALPANAIWHHSPNEMGGAGAANARMWSKQKAMGAKAGWPDIEIICPGSPPLFIELKTKGGVISPEQNAVLQSLQSAGAQTAVRQTLAGVKEFVSMFVEGIEE